LWSFSSPTVVRGPWPGQNDGVVGQGEDALAVGAEGFFVIHHAAAHGAGEEGVADDGEAFGQAGHDEGGAAARVAAGAERSDFQSTHREHPSIGERLGVGEQLAFADECRCACGIVQAVEIGDVVGMRVGQQNQRKV